MEINRRQVKRVNVTFPVQIQYGDQIVINGKIRNISLKSAFVDIGNSIYLKMDDRLKFNILVSKSDKSVNIFGKARISRVSADKGVAIYFVKMDNKSQSNLKKLFNSNS